MGALETPSSSAFHDAGISAATLGLYFFASLFILHSLPQSAATVRQTTQVGYVAHLDSLLPAQHLILRVFPH